MHERLTEAAAQALKQEVHLIRSGPAPHPGRAERRLDRVRPLPPAPQGSPEAGIDRGFGGAG